MAFLVGGANSASGAYEIENSLRFNDGDSPRLTKAQANGNQDRWTWSGWVKRSTLGSAQCFFATTDGSATSFDAKFDANDSLDVYNYLGGGFGARLVTNRKFRDVSAWYHIVIVYDSGNATEAQRLRIYVNGTEESSFSTTNYPSLNEDSDLNVSGSDIEIGRQANGSQFFDGYMAEMFLLDGTVYAPTAFGETNDEGVWIPKDCKDDLTFGTNGFYFEFKNINPILGDAAGRHKIDPSNGATFNTSIKKFGSSSLYLDNTNNFLDIIGVNKGDFGFGACNSNSWTIEFWVYYLGNSSSGSDFIVHGDNNSFKVNWRPGDPQFKVEVQDTEYAFGNNSPGLTDDTWTHIAIVNEGGTLKIYKDGTVDGTTHDISGKTVGTPNNIYVGYSDADTFDGHIDELRISDSARYTGNFSVDTSIFDVDSNTKLLLHMDTDPSIGTDSSGQGNHFTSVNFTVDDQCTDTPTNNFATLNPLSKLNSPVTAEGNLEYDSNSSSGSSLVSTIAPSNGKWYVEVKALTSTIHIGISEVGLKNFEGQGASRPNINYQYGGGVEIDGSIIDNEATFTTNDIIGLALNLDDGELIIYKNGTALNSGTAYNLHTNTTHGNTGFSVQTATGSGNTKASFNFGNPSFSISSGNADANGYGNFEYAVPSGYYALCTKNLGQYG